MEAYADKTSQFQSFCDFGNKPGDPIFHAGMQ